MLSKKVARAGSRPRPPSDLCEDAVVDDDELFVELSERLRLAHRRLATLEATDDEKARITRRLLAISDATKHDLGRASRRLDVFEKDLDAGWRPTANDD